MSVLGADLPGLFLLYGYPVLFATVLAGAIGVPLPSSVLLFAAGGFAANDQIDLVPIALVAVVAAVTGDIASYGLARWFGEAAVGQYGHRIGLSAARLDTTRESLFRWSGAAVFFTRWFLTPAAVPVNVVAALEKYPLSSFVLASLIGELLWVTIYVGGGFMIAGAWDDMIGLLGESLGFVGGLVVLIAAIAVTIRLTRRDS
jgi:membrane-associated protein